MARRDAALRAMRDHDISQRRACVLIGVDPKTVRRDRPPDNPEIREEMHKIAEKRRRFGYRRVGIMLERKGMIMNEKKLYRIYREEGLSVRRRRGRKRARGSRTQMPVPLQPNQRWSLDFLSDTFGACRRFRILAVNDDCCRENLALIADTSISGARVARELDALVRVYGKPVCIVSDNGTEFTSKAILKWANENGVEWHYIEIASDVLARTVDVLRSLDLGRVNWVAATVLRNVERDMIRARNREAGRAKLGSDIAPDEVSAHELGLQSLPEDAALPGYLHKLLGADALLVIRVAIEGYSQVEAGFELGLTEAAARKRYQRALRKLRDALADIP